MATVKKIGATLKRKLRGPKDKTAKAVTTQIDTKTTVEKKSKYFHDNSTDNPVNSAKDRDTLADSDKALGTPADTVDNTAGTSANTDKTVGAASMKNRLGFSFYDVSCRDLAQSLLGQKLVMMVGGKRCAGLIVETEAYLGGEDKAAHSYNGKRTARNEAMYMAPGTAYVYNIYGMYCCLNISAQGDGAAVLLRSIQATENLEAMADRRLTKTTTNTAKLLKNDGKDLCNGPSKICQAFGIKKDTINKVDMCSSGDIWLEKGEVIPDDQVVKCARINIGYAQEWVEKPFRFYIHGNKFNSVRDKKVEEEMST